MTENTSPPGVHSPAGVSSTAASLGWPGIVTPGRDLGYPTRVRDTSPVIPGDGADADTGNGVESDSPGVDAGQVEPAVPGDPGITSGEGSVDHPAEDSRRVDDVSTDDDGAVRQGDSVVPGETVTVDSVSPPGSPDVPRETDELETDAVPRETNPTPSAVTAMTAAPAEVKPDETRDAAPRRAKFDEDEFGEPPVDDEPVPVASTVPRETRSLPAPRQPRILVVANQKGGVGKTTTSVNLAVGLAQGGLDVLVVDLDPQGNASTALGVEHPPGTPGTYEVLIDGLDLADHVVESPEVDTLRVLPATIDLAAAEIELVSTVARESRLLKALKKYLKNNSVDYVFLDCPPSLGLLTLNALVAASEILIPIQCEYYALEGVSQLLNTINLVKGELNDDLELSTVLLTMYDGRTRLASQVADEVREHFPDQTLPQLIPRSVRISEAPSYGQSVLTYHPESAGAVSYREAAAEIARRGAEENA